MARKSTEQLISDLIDKAEIEVRDTLLDAIAAMRNGPKWAALVAAIEAKDIEAVIDMLALDPSTYSTMRLAMMVLHNQAGLIQAQQVSSLPVRPRPFQEASGSTIAFHWNMSNPRAEALIQTQSSTLITNLVEEQRANVRNALNAGYAAGQHPDTIARDIAGRMNRATGKREGGILGLSAPQIEHVTSMRSRLASGDPAEMRKVFEMQRRDKRFDGVINEAIAKGKPVAEADIARITQRYADRLLALRAETIARTETGEAVMAARAEAMRQAAEKSGYPDEAIEKEWRHGARLENARMQHVAMHKKRVTGLNTPFTLPDGTKMQHPMDKAGGAKHTIGCRCTVRYQIDYSWGVD